MAGELAQLGIQVTTNASQASADLDKLASSSAKAEQATTSLSKSSASSAASASGLTKAQQEYVALVQAGIPVHQRYIDAVGGATEAQKLLAASAGSTAASLAQSAAKQAAASASAAAAAVTGSAETVGAHEAVVASSIQVREALVLMREASVGNFTRMAGSASILAGTFGLMTGSALAIIAPILVVTAAFAAFEIAVYKSAEANREFENTLAGIGRTGSASLADVDQAAKQTSASVGVSISQAQEWAQTYATTGKVGGDVLTGLTSITKEYAEATGKDTTDAVKALADAFADPAKGAQTLNDQLGFLNVTQMTHIKQLADEGDRLGAQKALYAGLDKALDETANVHVHGLIKAWQDVWTWASNAWHAMVIAAGGGDLLEDLTKANKILSDDLAKGWGENTDAIKFDRQEVEKAKAAYDSFNASVKKAQDQNTANDLTKSAQPIIDKMFPDDATLRKLQADYDTLAKAQKAAVAAGESPAEMAKTTDALLATGQAIGRVTDAYKEYGGSAGVAHQIAVLQAQAASTTDQATKGQIATQIHLLQTLGDLTPAQQRLTAAQDAGAIVADKVHKTTDGVVTSYNKYMQQLRDQTASQNALNAAVASGSMTVQQAIAQEKLDKELKSQIAAIEQDTKISLADKLQKIRDLTDAQKDYNASQDVGDFQKITDEMQTQVKLAGMSSDERDRENAVLSAQHQINGTLSIDDANKLRAQEDQLKAAQQLGRVADGVQSSFQDFFTTVFSGGKDAFHNLVDSIKNQFAQLLAWMVVQAIAQPIIVPVIGAITGAAGLGSLASAAGGTGGISNIFGSLGSLTSAGSATGATGFLGGIGSQISSATSWLTNGINSLGGYLGFGTSALVPASNVMIPASGGFLPMSATLSGQSLSLPGSLVSGSLTSTLGAAGLGYGLGSMGASLLGGNSSSAQQTNGMIGSALGAAVGSIIPGLGTMLGSALGGVIGGLIGPKESAHRATANFDSNYAVTGITGTKMTDQSQSAATQAGQSVAQVVQALQGAGIHLTNSIEKLTISQSRDKSFITTSTGQRIDVGKAGDAQAAVSGTINYLTDGMKSANKQVQQVIDHYQALGGITADNAQQFGDDITFAKSLASITHQVTFQLGGAADALKQVKAAYDADIERAKSLGVSTSQLLANEQKDIKAMASSFNASVKSQLLSITDPVLASFDQISAAAKALVSDAKAIGGNLKQAQALNAATMQQFIAGLSDADKAALIASGDLTHSQVLAVKAVRGLSDGIDALITSATDAASAAQQASQAWTSAQQSLDQSRTALLVSGPGVSPQNAYLAAQQQYADLLSKAKTDPQAASDFASFASQFLQTSLTYNATGGQFGADQAKVQSDLASLSSLAGTQATAADKLATQAQAQVDALNVIKDQLASGGPSLSVLQRQLKTQQDLNATMLAVLDQLGGHRAAGGAVTAGQSYLVGENRAEIFTPGVSGYISPNISLPTPRGGFSNDNAVDDLKAELRQLRADAASSAKANADLLRRVESAIAKTGGDQVSALNGVKGELKHGNAMTSLHGKARANRKRT